MDKIEKLEPEQYQIYCIRCLNKINLTMHPHRRDGLIVGFIYVCIDCEEKVSGKEITVESFD